MTKEHMVDSAMSLGLLALMSYQRIGEEVHEWLGFLEGCLFLIHLFYHRKWIMHIGKGSYTTYRYLQTSIFLGMLLCVIVQLFSGIILSKTVFTFLPLQGMKSFARQCHMLAGYWGFVFLCFHIGLHGSMLSSIRKQSKRVYDRAFIFITMITTMYGAYAMMQRDIVSYMFQRIEFAYFDYKEPLFFFFFDYLCIFLFLVNAMHFIVNRIHKQKKRIPLRR